MPIFADNAPEIWEHDVSVIPISPNTKRAFIDDWSQYCDNLPTQTEMDFWCEQYGAYNLGICMGAATGVVGFDLDVNTPELESYILNFLPKSWSSKKGKKGATYFYKFENQIGRKFKYKNVQLFDFLSTGTQTVMPPSVHPDTGKPYFWIGDPFYGRVDDLPRITDQQVEFIYEQACKFIDKGDPTLFQSDSSGEAGRNEDCKAFVCGMFNSIQDVMMLARRVLQYSTMKYGKNCLFHDQSEFRNRKAKPIDNAVQFVTSVVNSVARNRVRRGDTFEEEPNQSKYKENIESGFYTSKDGKRVPLYDELARYLKDEIGLISYDEYNYLFTGTHYRPVNKHYLLKYMKELTNDVMLVSHYDHFYRAATVKTQASNAPQNEPGYVNFANGVYNVTTGEFTNHSKDRYFSYVLPYDYDPSAKCDSFKSWLFECMHKDQQSVDTFFEFLGYTLEGSNQYLQTALIIIGKQRTGKSALLNVVKDILGSENVGSVSLDKLGAHFEVHTLNGKLANIIDEAPDDGIQADKFKIMTSGGYVNVSQKNKPFYRLRVDAKFITTANDLLKFKSSQSVKALSRRQLYLPWHQDYGQSIINYEKRFMKEASGIYNEAFQALARLKKRGNIQMPEFSRKTAVDFEANQDAVHQYLEDMVDVTIPCEGFVSLQMIWEWYSGDHDVRNKVRKREFYKRARAYFEDTLGVVVRITRGYDGVRNLYFPMFSAHLRKKEAVSGGKVVTQVLNMSDSAP